MTLRGIQPAGSHFDFRDPGPDRDGAGVYRHDTQRYPAGESRCGWQALACWVSAGVLAAFRGGGEFAIFRVMGITLPARFQMAGEHSSVANRGLDMLYWRRRSRQRRKRMRKWQPARSKMTSRSHRSECPMMAGPGAISTVLILENQAIGVTQNVAVLFASIALICFVSYWVFWLAVHGTHYVKPLALKLMTRLFGLVLASMAVQFFLNGLQQTPFLKR